MLVKGNNGKSPARRKSASSSAKPSRSNSVPKSNSRSSNGKAADQLDGSINQIESPAVESETGDRILETARAGDGASGDGVSTESTELTAITLHEPWASLIALGHKQYETRDWSTNYRGPIAIHAGRKPAKWNEHKLLVDSFRDLLEYKDCEYGAVIAIAELTDCILMTEEFISQQSPTELRCGNWQVGRYAFKLENVRAIAPIPATGKQGLWKWSSDSWNPADFGEVQHAIEADGQLSLLEWDVNEPPEPDDYESIELFDQAYKQWEDSQQSTVSSQQSGTKLEYFCSECRTWMPRNQIKEEFFGDYQTQLCKSCLNEVYHEFDARSPQLEIEGEKLCNTLMDGSICAAELARVSPMPESSCGSDRPITSVNGTATAEAFLLSGIPASTELPISESVTSISAAELSSLAHLHHANPSQLTENDLQPKTPETAFQMSSELSENSSQNLLLSKTSLGSSTAPIPPETSQEVTLGLSSTPYPRSGSMQNGKLSAAPTLPAPGVESECLLLRSPGALSGSTGVRPPGKSRLETQLNQLGLIQDGEVAAPEFLELGYQLPIGWTNLQESRTALELSQVQAQQSSIAHKSELPAETETTETGEKPSAIAWTGESPLSDSSELSISVALPLNIGALEKAELISMAQKQHQLICVIERKEFELAIEKLHRARLTGVYLQEFKKKCQYGEFETQLKQAGISVRSAQNYMAIAKNWEIVEAKTKHVSLLAEESQPTFSLRWALEAVRDEKKQLKSAAPPKDPDSWRTPNTKDQPIVDLVKQALGGTIWLDPCSGSVTNNIPCAVRYFKDDNGLAQHQGWSKTVFINPPFSDPFPWVERCCFEFARGNVSAAIMLLKAGTVSNMGTGELINKYASAICHWRGRINFLNDEGNAVKGSDFDCVFVYFGARLDLFRTAFGQRGTIATIDNHYSSVNKKFLDAPLPEPQTLKSEEKQLAAAVGLGNGRSVLPDRRDFDRELAERYDPHTVVDVLSMPTPISENFSQSAKSEEAPLQQQFEAAKDSCLNDYITAISSNLSAFSDEQVSFLAKIINEESAKRIGF